jgi:hypothetical protein
VEEKLTLNQPVILDVAKHNRAAFICGVSELDVFIKEKAKKEAEQNLNKTFVLTSKERPAEIIGYYTLSPKHIKTADLPIELTGRLPRYNNIGVTLLGRFAIADKYQSATRKDLRLGTLLLNDAKFRAWRASQEIGSFALIVDVLVGEKGDPTAFYLRYDFIQFPNKPNQLYLPMKTIEKSLRTSGLI